MDIGHMICDKMYKFYDRPGEAEVLAELALVDAGGVARELGDLQASTLTTWVHRPVYFIESRNLQKYTGWC